MISKTFEATKGDKTNQATVLEAMDLLDAYIMSTFNNVVRVQKLNLADDAYRYSYLIDGFENLYLSIENGTSTSSSSVSVTLQKTSQITKAANVGSSSDYLAVTMLSVGILSGGIATLRANFISYNGRLKAIAITDSATTMQPFYYVNQAEGKYVISTGGATTSVSNGRDVFKDNADASRYYLYQGGLYYYAPSEANALMRRAVITGTSASNYNSPLECFIDGVYNIVNFAFANGVYNLIQVGNKKYRQICSQYLFVEDGDTE